jgi:hypothetical protein
MTENLHTRLVAVLNAADIHPALSEDEIDSYPYVTFELPTECRYTKDGNYKIVGNLTIRSVSDDFDQADELRSGIEAAVAEGFQGPEYTSRLTDVRKDCMDGVWVIEQDYILNQYD